MDTFMWQPGWVEASPEVFRERLRAALDQDERGWVADGNYDRRGGLMAFEEATDVICQLIIHLIYTHINIEYHRARSASPPLFSSYLFPDHAPYSQAVPALQSRV